MISLNDGYTPVASIQLEQGNVRLTHGPDGGFFIEGLHGQITGVPSEVAQIFLALTREPENFTPRPQLKRVLGLTSLQSERLGTYMNLFDTLLGSGSVEFDPRHGFRFGHLARKEF